MLSGIEDLASCASWGSCYAVARSGVVNSAGVASATNAVGSVPELFLGTGDALPLS